MSSEEGDEVKQILVISKKSNQQYFCLVQFEGEEPHEASWVPLQKVQQSIPKTLEKFKKDWQAERDKIDEEFRRDMAAKMEAAKKRKKTDTNTSTTTSASSEKPTKKQKTDTSNSVPTPLVPVITATTSTTSNPYENIDSDEEIIPKEKRKKKRVSFNDNNRVNVIPEVTLQPLAAVEAAKKPSFFESKRTAQFITDDDLTEPPPIPSSSTYYPNRKRPTTAVDGIQKIREMAEQERRKKEELSKAQKETLKKPEENIVENDFGGSDMIIDTHDEPSSVTQENKPVEVVPQQIPTPVVTSSYKNTYPPQIPPQRTQQPMFTDSIFVDQQGTIFFDCHSLVDDYQKVKKFLILDMKPNPNVKLLYSKAKYLKQDSDNSTTSSTSNFNNNILKSLIDEPSPTTTSKPSKNNTIPESNKQASSSTKSTSPPLSKTNTSSQHTSHKSFSQHPTPKPSSTQISMQESSTNRDESPVSSNKDSKNVRSLDSFAPIGQLRSAEMAVDPRIRNQKPTTTPIIENATTTTTSSSTTFVQVKLFPDPTDSERSMDVKISPIKMNDKEYVKLISGDIKVEKLFAEAEMATYKVDSMCKSGIFFIAKIEPIESNKDFTPFVTKLKSGRRVGYIRQSEDIKIYILYPQSTYIRDNNGSSYIAKNRNEFQSLEKVSVSEKSFALLIYFHKQQSMTTEGDKKNDPSKKSKHDQAHDTVKNLLGME